MTVNAINATVRTIMSEHGALPLLHAMRQVSAENSELMKLRHRPVSEALCLSDAVVLGHALAAMSEVPTPPVPGRRCPR